MSIQKNYKPSETISFAINIKYLQTNMRSYTKLMDD